MANNVKARTPREEFEKYKRRFLKENDIKHLICARCGEWRTSVHLHHIKELVYGGTNDAYNLIPLCGECHDEWDKWDNDSFEFGTFLLTPKTRDLRRVFFGKLAISSHSLAMYRGLMIPVRSQEWAAMYEDEDVLDYKTEFIRQNKLFAQYPYSDVEEMLTRYGNVPDPMLLEDLSMLSEGKTLEDCIRSRGSVFTVEMEE